MDENVPFQKAITDISLSARDISKSVWINVTWPGANFVVGIPKEGK